MRESLWPATAFMFFAALIGLQTLRRCRTANTSPDEKKETAKWAITFLIIAPLAVASFFVTLYTNKLWPFLGMLIGGD